MVTGLLLIFPLLLLGLGHRLDETFHPVSGLLAHLLRGVGVDVSVKVAVACPKFPCTILISSPLSIAHHGVGMPLWHNKDKSETHCGTMGLWFVPILFPLKTALKWGLREEIKYQSSTWGTNFLEFKRDISTGA